MEWTIKRNTMRRGEDFRCTSSSPYALVVAADWLHARSPHIYAIYKFEKDIPENVVATINIVAIVSTVVGDVLTQPFGTQTVPFLAASASCVGAAYLIARVWNESFGAQSAERTWIETLKRYPGDDPRAQDLRPGRHVIFFRRNRLPVPLLPGRSLEEHPNKSQPRQRRPPFLLILFSFMCATMAGSVIYTLLIAAQTTQGAFNVVMAMTLIASYYLSLGAVLQTESLLFWVLSVRGVRRRLPPRHGVPESVLVLVAYGLGEEGDIQRKRVFFVCSGLLLVAFLVARRNFQS
ncbi:hypothetical protein DL765_009709 [Monosporascus sp. GIB2]|nr:hypothetical protein DL765_009709 [Monosporascus sp. GIB2]